MKKKRELLEERALKLQRCNELAAKAQTEELSVEESAEFDTIDGEIRQLDSDIERAERIEARQAAQAKQTGEKGNKDTSDADERDIRSYQIVRAIQAKLDNRALDGIEMEMHQEAVKEARAFGQTINGIGIPVVVTEKRDNSVTNPTQPGDGSAVVENTLRGDLSIMEMLRNDLVTRQLGATYLDGLTDNVHWTKMTERPKASWNTETGSLDKSNAKFSVENFIPKRVGTYVLQSLQFLRQTAPYVERQIRKELAYAFSEAIDEAAIKGTGVGNQPTGILYSTAVASVPGFPPALGANGGDLTRDKLIALETALAKRNLRGRTYGYLLNAVTRGKLKATKLDEGSGKFLMEANDKLLEYKAIMSNMVPSDLDKGDAIGVCSAIILGDWEHLIIGNWGGVDLIVDNVTLAVEGQVKLVAQTFANVTINRPEAFVYYKDVLTNL